MDFIMICRPGWRYLYEAAFLKGPGRDVPSLEVSTEIHSPVSTEDPGQRGDCKKMTVEMLHVLLLVTTVDCPLYVVDCECQLNVCPSDVTIP